MKKAKIRVLSLMFVICMLFGTLASCGGNTSDSGTVGQDSGSAAVTETGHVDKITLPETQFDGATFTIFLAANGPDTVNDFDSEAATNNIMSEAVNRRNLTVEDLLGVKIETVVDFKYGNSGYSKMFASHQAYTKDYDASFIGAYDVVPLSYNGCLYDLNSLPYLDPKNSWWDQGAYDEIAINDILFFTTGDIAYWDDLNQYCVAFNKEVFKINSEKDGYPDSIYSMVNEGGWTYDAMLTMAKAVTNDLDGNDRMDMKDAFGIITWDDTVYGVLNSAGQKVVDTAEDGVTLFLTLAGNETAINALSDYTDIWLGGDAINYQQAGTGFTQAGCEQMFMNNNALFYMTRLSTLELLRDMKVDYGILPYPKYQESQERYYTTVSPYHMNFACVLNIVDGADMSGAVLEALAYYSKDIITPAYYQTTLEGTYFRDDESADMLRLLADSRFYDIGYYIQPNNINKELIYLYRNGSKDFASTFEAKRDAAEAAVEEVNDAYAEAFIEWQK